MKHPVYHGHLGSNQMLKNVEFLNQKMEMLRKNIASHCKGENVCRAAFRIVEKHAVWPKAVSGIITCLVPPAPPAPQKATQMIALSPFKNTLP